jgi:histidinol-phosphate aminotransferase
MVKLDAMENPYRLPHALQVAAGPAPGRSWRMNRYPDSRVNDLRAALAAYAGMPDGFDIMLGNGSDELISAAGAGLRRAIGFGPTILLAPVPGFVMYAMSAQLQGLDFHGVPLDGRL